MNKYKKPALLLFIFFLIIIAGIFFLKYQNVQKAVTSPQVPQLEDTKQLVDEVGKLMVLPKEVPTIATVTDITKLKNQPFFANAKNGDRVLLYTQAKKAILYRPSIKKIIDVEPINFTSNQIATGSATISRTPTKSASQSSIINK